MNNSKKNKRMLPKKILCLLAVGLLCSFADSYAAKVNALGHGISEQQQAKFTVQGKVIDATGEPLVGVSVTVKGTTQGVMTDIDGNYSISTTSNATLVFSYISFKSQIVQVNNRQSINITLLEDAQMMQEVVVVGYGVQKKENLTGAVSSVRVEETLGSRPIADVGRGLQGAVAGLTVTLPSGEIGADPSMKIRGQIGSLSGSSKPLLLVDNVEVPSIQMINPDDIESISVLKDAASASIYGSKAAFGVILITTKRGAKTESVTVSYSNNFSWQNIAKKMEMAGVNGLEYALLAAERIGSTSSGVFWKVDRTSLERAKEWQTNYGGSVSATDPLIYGRDWYRQGNSTMGLRTYDPYETMIREWSPSQSHNLSINGKSGKTAYNVGLGYLDQNGMTKPAAHDDFRRYNASVNLTTEINKYITVRAGALYSDRTKRYPTSAASTSDPWYYMYRWSAISPIGVQENGEDLRDPVAEIKNTKTGSINNKYKSINLGTTINLTSNWDVKFDYTYVDQVDVTDRALVDFTARDSWASTASPTLVKDAQGNQIYVDQTGAEVSSTAIGAMPKYQFTSITYNPPGGAGNTQNQIYRKSRSTSENVINAYTTYNLKLGGEKENVFKFLLGINSVSSKYNENWTQKTQLLDFNNPQFTLATGTESGSGLEGWESQLGYFGRVNYAFKDKYLLEGNLRYDGSSKFPSNLRWRWFPSFSGGWIASNEKFMQPLTNVIGFMKFRASWGIVGDQTVPSDLYTSTLTNYTTTWLSGDSRFESFRTPTVVQNDISWQDIENLNLGVDLRVVNDKVGIAFDWFQRKTKNMIINGDALPFTFGASAPKGNYGNLKTTGWELAVDFNHRFANGLSLNATVTLADAITDITKNADYQTPRDQRSIANGANFTGKRYGDIYGYKTDRLYQKDDFVTDANGNLVFTTIIVDGVSKQAYQLKGDNPVYQGKLQSGKFYFGPGDVKFVDLNGDGVINNGTETLGDMGDLTVIGNSTPRYEYGFRLGADFKGIDFSVFFQGVGKRDIWGSGPLAIAGFNSSDGSMPNAIADDFWTEDRTDAFYPRPFNLAGSNNTYNMVPQSRYLLNMAYLRMKNITLGYSIDPSILKKVKLTKARIYVSFENLLTFDNLNGLPIDPEAVSGTSIFNETNYNSGRLGTGVPTFKTASVGVQLAF